MAQLRTQASRIISHVLYLGRHQTTCPSHLVFTLLPIIAKALLNTIVLLLARCIGGVLAIDNTLLSLLALNSEVGAELDGRSAALGELVELRLLGRRRAVFLLVLAARERAFPDDGVGDLWRESQPSKLCSSKRQCIVDRTSSSPASYANLNVALTPCSRSYVAMTLVPFL
jgi:hypothetical protein